jgi:hypothetical protein
MILNLKFLKATFKLKVLLPEVALLELSIHCFDEII